MLGTLLSVLFSIAAAAVVGVKMLGVARRTRQLPEWCVGVGMLAFAGGQLGMLLSGALGQRLGPGASHALMACVLVAFVVVTTALALFTVQTFGATGWRWALFGAVVVPGVAVRVVIYSSADSLSAGPAALRSLAAASIASGFVWLGSEALHYYRKARRACEI